MAEYLFQEGKLDNAVHDITYKQIKQLYLDNKHEEREGKRITESSYRGENQIYKESTPTLHRSLKKFSSKRGQELYRMVADMRIADFEVFLKKFQHVSNWKISDRYTKVGMKMCGRYYVDDDTAREIEELIRQIDEKMRKAENIHLQAGDIHPSEAALVIAADHNDLCCKWQRWGFPGFNGKQLIFNARSESALEKRMFKESVEHRRIVVPATWFYEWNKNKEKNIFYSAGHPVLYMVGFYNHYQNEDRFVILTTAANESMKPVHDRMPLLLERDEIGKWLFDDNLTKALLQKTPALLERRTDFEQMSLFPAENSK